MEARPVQERVIIEEDISGVSIVSTGPTPQSIDFGEVGELDLGIASDSNASQVEKIDLEEV